MNFLRGINKAVTFSFDDGNTDDIRLVKLLNKYGLKATFNLNAGKLTASDSHIYNNKEVRRNNFFETLGIYSGHEIACHGYTHSRLDKMSKATCYTEVALDKMVLSFLFNYNVRGMAYPYGAYNEDVIATFKECGIAYARTVGSSYSFELPNDFYRWTPTCHVLDLSIKALVDKFLKIPDDKPMLLYIWGHSYEFMTENDWCLFEKICEKLVNNSGGIAYLTNIEIIDSINRLSR